MADKVFCSRKQLDKLLKKMASKIDQVAINNKSNDVIVLGVLNGVIPTMGELMTRVSQPNIKFDTVRYKSYNGIFSKGKVKCTKKPEINLKDRIVIILDDIIESGDTMHAVIKDIRKHKPDDILTAALFKRAKSEFVVDILGTVVPRGWWLYGFGLDNDQLDRNLPIVKYKKVENAEQ